MASYCCFRKPRRVPEATLNPTWLASWPSKSISFQNMVELLVRPNIGVVVIQGPGGTGKTWAAQAAYQIARTRNLFDDYIWVSLSKTCSMRQCINKIATSLLCNHRDSMSVQRIKTRIKEYLTKRKFLLVLDNAYFTDEENILEYLGVPHPQQQSLGSKIFVTTITMRTFSVMDPEIYLTPQPLTYEVSYNILREKIGENFRFANDLISNCYGAPLIIILLAGALCDAPTQEAYSELVEKAHVALGTEVSVLHTMERIVKFGYHQLPSNNARHCLLYCLLFPEDQGISVKELIWHWIMDGLLQETIGFEEANHNGKKILDVLIKHGMVYLEDNDRVRMHDVVRETLLGLGYNIDYEEQSYQYLDNLVEYLAKCKRVPLMYTEIEYLHGSPHCFFLRSLLLRGNYLLKYISEEFFCHMETLGILDLSFTGIKMLPSSISSLTRLRMLLLSGCNHLEEIRHVASLLQLEVLDASSCGSLKSIESGSFDRMTMLKILDLSATSITFLLSIPVSMELRHVNLQGCPFVGSELPYGISRSGIVQELKLGRIEDLADWMHMSWLPCGLTFQLSNRFGLEVSLDVNKDGKAYGNTYIYASDACFFNCLEKDSPLWFNCFQMFRIVISPLMDGQTMDTDAQITKTDFIFQKSYFRTMHFTYSIDFKRYLELNGTAGVPSDLESILYHAELISLKGLKMVGQFMDLNIRSMKSVKELQIQNCEQLESLLTPDEIQATFCKGLKDVTSFSCMKHLLLDCCPNLTCLFPLAVRIPGLETLNIRFCDILERVFDTCLRRGQSSKVAVVAIVGASRANLCVWWSVAVTEETQGERLCKTAGNPCWSE